MTDSIKTREYNMDILRAILIYAVIVLHYNNRGMGGALNYASIGGVHEFIVRFSESLCICAVNTFLILSGFFAGDSKSKPYKKALRLLIACSFYRTVAYILHALLVIHEFSIRTLVSNIIPSNWFVCLFITVLVLSPFINKLLTSLDKKQLLEFILVMAVMFVAVPTVTEMVTDMLGVNLTGLSTITVSGDIQGFTIVCFIFCYCLGYFIKSQKETINKVPNWVYLLGFFELVFIASIISFASETVWSYSNIFTVLEAALITIFFSRIKFQNKKIGKIISLVGKCGLGVFVWHTSPLMLYGFWVHFDIARIAEGSVGFYLTNMIAATVSMYIVSVIWVLVCRRVACK